MQQLVTKKYIEPEILIEKMKTEGGFTVHAVTGESPTEGYMVSLPDYEQSFDFSDIYRANIAGYMDKYREQLEASHYYLGGWVDTRTNLAYFDISVNIPTRKLALDLGVYYGQKCVFDVARKESIYIEDDGGEAAALAAMERGITECEDSRMRDRV